ncbi:MAG: DUF4405 domain-containing protein [Aurantimonas coralicida]|uniref:DUF4405 domain-containing protein n=1 Tax=Bauldia litoralis TaxID=665467 RepID=UPI00327C84CE
MTAILRLRLVLDLVAFGLLLFGLSYWWLGNIAHEVAGTAFFLLLIVHNVFNRRWYGRAARPQRDLRSKLNVPATLALLVVMLALLATSILISNALSPLMSAYGGFTVRQIHTLAAYWALVIVAVHLGFRWPMIMGMARSLFGITGRSTLRAIVLRLVTLAIAVQGVVSSLALGLGGKLTMQVSLDWWNFEESVLGFFGHAAAIVVLCVSVTHYGLKLVEAGRSAVRKPA